MKSRFFVTVALMLVLYSPGGCATQSEEIRSEYGHLKTAVEASAYAVIGVYGEAIPPDFNAAKFMQVVEGKIPDQEYRELEKYPITVESKGTYYLLIVKNRDTNAIILFDFSCTPQADGVVYLNPEHFDTNNLDQYDPCKTTQKSQGSVSGENSK